MPRGSRQSESAATVSVGSPSSWPRVMPGATGLLERISPSSGRIVIAAHGPDEGFQIASPAGNQHRDALARGLFLQQGTQPCLRREIRQFRRRETRQFLPVARSCCRRSPISVRTRRYSAPASFPRRSPRRFGRLALRNSRPAAPLRAPPLRGQMAIMPMPQLKVASISVGPSLVSLRSASGTPAAMPPRRRGRS